MALTRPVDRNIVGHRFFARFATFCWQGCSMHTPSSRSSTATAVPLLDVSRQNDGLRDDLLAALADVCDSGRFIHGPQCAELESRVAEYCQAGHAVACASGSDALLLALMVLDIGPGDEVILPSFTFFATAGAVWRLGAKPVFADIEPHTFNVDLESVRRQITPATRAIIPVHLFGQCADMDALAEIAADAKIAIIEDAAQAIGAQWCGRRAGSMGRLGCFSFYPTKNLGGCGDGGMITTDDAQLAARLRILRDHGQHPQYHHQLVGINSRLDTLQAAALLVKLARLDRWTTQRRENAERYAASFARLGLSTQLGLPAESNACHHVWNQYTIRVPGGARDELRERLAAAGIGSAVYYPVPLHLQECFAPLGYQRGSLPETERAAREVLSLPIFPGLTVEEIETVVDAVGRALAECDRSAGRRRDASAA
jgi:dTDP-4-amino-4,6-dideoxygalactose transaminase